MKCWKLTKTSCLPRPVLLGRVPHGIHPVFGKGWGGKRTRSRGYHLLQTTRNKWNIPPKKPTHRTQKWRFGVWKIIFLFLRSGLQVPAFSFHGGCYPLDVWSMMRFYPKWNSKAFSRQNTKLPCLDLNQSQRYTPKFNMEPEMMVSKRNLLLRCVGIDQNQHMQRISIVVVEARFWKIDIIFPKDPGEHSKNIRNHHLQYSLYLFHEVVFVGHFALDIYHDPISETMCKKVFLEKKSTKTSSYCWWKKSYTSWSGKFPIIFRVLYIPNGQMVQDFFHQQYHTKLKLGGCFCCHTLDSLPNGDEFNGDIAWDQICKKNHLKKTHPG